MRTSMNFRAQINGKEITNPFARMIVSLLIIGSVVSLVLFLSLWMIGIAVGLVAFGAIACAISVPLLVFFGKRIPIGRRPDAIEAPAVPAIEPAKPPHRPD